MAKKTAKTYRELKNELQEIIDQLQDESIDIDRALELHKMATVLIKELEAYLQKTKHKFEVIKSSKK